MAESKASNVLSTRNTQSGTLRWVRKANGIVPPVLSLLVILIAWEFYVAWSGISAFILPSPTRIFQAAAGMGSGLYLHTITTTWEILTGFFLGNVLALVLAYCIVHWPLAERIFYPILIMSQTVPKLAIAPLLVIWFGTGLTPKIVIIVLICFFPTAVNAVQGLRSADPNAIDLARLVTSSKRTIFTKIQFPASLPYFFAGLKISMAAAVVGAIVAEWIGATRGLGYLILYGSQSMRTDLTFVGVFATVLLGMLLYGAVGLVELLTSWQAKNRPQS